MTRAERDALADVRGYASAGRYTLTAHAWRRAAERGVRPKDVRCALAFARSCAGQGDGTWKVQGQDTAGDDLTAVVVIEDGVLVVTLF